MLAAIPYTTFPTIDLGFFQLRTFGLMVGLGVLLGAWIAARYIEERAAVPREDSYRMATRLVVSGVIGARLTWVISHWDQIGSPVDIIAVWQGGLQFSGGFLGAIIFGIPFFRRWERHTRWIALDGYAYGLAIGLAVGRIGCYSVGEHFGSLSNFLLAVRYDGGEVREDFLGDIRLVPGMSFHNLALYEMVYLAVLFGLLSLLVRRQAGPATLMGVFCVFYGACRFGTDFLRVNDRTVLGLTGAQYLSASIVGAGLWILTVVRPGVGSTVAAAETVAGDDPPPTDDDDDATDDYDDDTDTAAAAAGEIRPPVDGDDEERLEPVDER